VDGMELACRDRREARGKTTSNAGRLNTGAVKSGLSSCGSWENDRVST
jgi:hypothetical protein